MSRFRLTGGSWCSRLSEREASPSVPGAPAKLNVIGDVTEEPILDLEAAGRLMVSYAISISDFVVAPMQRSQLDTK